MGRILVLFVVLFEFGRIANAGKEAHGGGVSLCPGPGGSEEAEFIDLWVGRSHPSEGGLGLPIADPSLPEEDPIQAQERFEQRALNRLKWLHRDYYDLVDYALRHLRLIENPVNGEIVIPGDMGSIIVPPGCEFAFAARYVEPSAFNGRRLDYSRDIWSKMTPFNRAALMVHEAVYLIEREKSQVLDSYRTRHVVAALFSTLAMENVGLGVPPGTELCFHEPSDRSELPTIYWRWSVEHIIRRQFLMVNGHYVLTRKYFDQPEDFGDGVEEFSTRTVSAFEKDDRIIVRKDRVTQDDLLQIGPITSYEPGSGFKVEILEDQVFLERSCGSGSKNPRDYARWIKFLKDPPRLED